MLVKKSIIKSSFKYYLLLIVLLLLISLAPQKKTDPLIISMTLKAPGCERADVFYNSVQNSSFNKAQVESITLLDSSEYNQYSIAVPAPVKSFRLDPCDQKLPSFLQKIEVKYLDKHRVIDANELISWPCSHCSKEISEEDGSLIINAHNPDPIIFTNS